MAKGDTVKDTRSEDEEEEGEEEEESRSEGVARNETLGCNGKEARIVYAKQADKKISWIILLTTKKKKKEEKRKKKKPTKRGRLRVQSTSWRPFKDSGGKIILFRMLLLVNGKVASLLWLIICFSVRSDNEL